MRWLKNFWRNHWKATLFVAAGILTGLFCVLFPPTAMVEMAMGILAMVAGSDAAGVLLVGSFIAMCTTCAISTLYAFCSLCRDIFWCVTHGCGPRPDSPTDSEHSADSEATEVRNRTSKDPSDPFAENPFLSSGDNTLPEFPTVGESHTTEQGGVELTSRSTGSPLPPKVAWGEGEPHSFQPVERSRAAVQRNLSGELDAAAGARFVMFQRPRTDRGETPALAANINFGFNAQGQR